MIEELSEQLAAETAGMSELERLEYLLRKARARLPRFQAINDPDAAAAIESEYRNIANLERQIDQARKP